MHYRILVLGKFKNYISYYLHGVIEGTIRNGWLSDRIELQKVNDNIDEGKHVSQLYERIARFKPHVMFTHSLFGTDREYYPGLFDLLIKVKKKFGTIVCHQEGDPRLTPRYEVDINGIVDMVLMNIGDEKILSNFSKIWNVPCYYWPYACLNQNEIGKPVSGFKHDMVYTGNMSVSDLYKPRTDFIKKCMKSGIFKLKRYPDANVGNTRFITPVIAASAKTILGPPAKTDIELYIDARPFEYLGAGGLLLRPYSSGIEKVFSPEIHMYLFTEGDLNELEELYMYCLENRSGSDSIKLQGFNFVQEYHNYKVRVRQVIDIIEGKSSKPKILLKDLP